MNASRSDGTILRSLSLCAGLPFLAAAALPAPGGPGSGGEGWPQWRGPHRDGITRETAWDVEGKEESLWETQVGLGYSAVVVGDGRLYTMGYDKDLGLDLVFCLDARTGEELWVHSYEAAIWDEAHEGGTVNTPSIDGDVVFTLNREGNLYCLEAETGEVRWHRDLEEEHELTYPRWGFSASPLLVDDQLILNVGRVLSVDKENGDVVWMTEDFGHAYATPVAFQHGDTPALAVFNGEKLAVLDRSSGEPLAVHTFEVATQGVSAATPIVIDDAVFVSSYRVGGSVLMALTDEGLEEVWASKVMTNQLSGCVQMDGYLYGYDQSVLKCIDTLGEEKWSVRGLGNGAVSGAPDRLLALSAKGELIVAEATPERFEELSRAQVFDPEDGQLWTLPVLVDGLIYCRSSRGRLVCRDHRLER